MDIAKIVILGSKFWKLGKHSSEKKKSVSLSIHLSYLYLPSSPILCPFSLSLIPKEKRS